MSVEVKVPEVGESITEGRLVEWLQEDGALVRPDDPLFELETDKITMTVEAVARGRLSIEVEADTMVQVGQVVARISPAAEEAADQRERPAPRDEEPPAEEPPVREPAQAQGGEQPAPAGAGERQQAAGEAARAEPPISPPAGFPQLQTSLAERTTVDELAPSVRRLALQHELDPARIEGTGRAGRLTKQDVLRHLEAREVTGGDDEQRPRAPIPLALSGHSSAARTGTPEAGQPRAQAPPAGAAREQAPGPQARPEAPLERGAEREQRETRRQMSPLRHRLAERLVQVQQTAAILTTFNEADMSGVLALRQRHRDAFSERHGVRLGIMSFFVKAVVDALRTVPQLNARIEGDEIVQQHYYDIGVAVSTDLGLVVPVLREADRKSFAEIELELGELARRARERKLTLADLSGGCFTVSNGGVFGSLLSTPILNPPQSGILGMHAIQRRPVAMGDDRIEIRPMMYLAMSYDHRLVDGREAVTFLKRVVECIESPERMMLEV